MGAIQSAVNQGVSMISGIKALKDKGNAEAVTQENKQTFTSSILSNMDALTRAVQNLQIKRQEKRKINSIKDRKVALTSQIVEKPKVESMHEKNYKSGMENIV